MKKKSLKPIFFFLFIIDILVLILLINRFNYTGKEPLFIALVILFVIIMILYFIVSMKENKKVIEEIKKRELKDSNYELPTEEEVKKLIPAASLGAEIEFSDNGLIIYTKNETINFKYDELEFYAYHDINARCLIATHAILIKTKSNVKEFIIQVRITKDVLFYINKFNIYVNNIDIINEQIKEPTVVNKFRYYKGSLVYRIIITTLIVGIISFLLIYYRDSFFVILAIGLIPLFITFSGLFSNILEFQITNESFRIINLSHNAKGYIDFRDIKSYEVTTGKKVNTEDLKKKYAFIIDDTPFSHIIKDKKTIVIYTTFYVFIIAYNELIEDALKKCCK